MKIALRCFCALVALGSPVQLWAAPPAAAVQSAETAEDRRLMALFADDEQRETAASPLAALSRDGKVNNAAFARLYTADLTRAMRASVERSLKLAARIDRDRLSAERQISYDVFLRDKREALDWLQPQTQALVAVRPMNHFAGLHMEFPALVAADGILEYRSAADYRRNLGLIRTMPRVIDNAIAQFRAGQASGVVESRLTITNMIAQIDGLLAQPVEASPFTSAVAKFPAAVGAKDRAALRRAYAEATRSEIYPAYRRLRQFLADDYLPTAREAVGLSAMKGGPELYRRLIAQQTTLPLEPDAVHQLGLAEVARIQREMDGVRQQLGFAGSLQAFFEHIRTDPRYHPTQARELSDGFAAVKAKVDRLAPQYFSRLPRTPLVIQPYPDYRAKYEAGGSYNQGTADGSRPGTFFYNTYDLPSRFLTGIATLYLHEGAPGHHFQISLAQEDSSLPDFQRFGGSTAFVEGWALYAETLGYEMGLYKDPLQHWGTLDDEMLRAMRLVVDTGLHAKGWSRDRAIAYMLGNSGMGRSDATAEVERYIAIPGQALSYKIGALTIQRLRRKAETELGSRFDIRAFHDQILGSGALPLPILEAKVDRWIAASK